jgi:hypothetical protein
MKRVWGHLAVGCSLLGSAALAAAACVHDDSTIFVQDVLAAQFVTPGQTCQFTADPTQTFISSGVLDIALRTSYTPTFLVGNQMVAESNSQQLQTETSTVTIQGAIVRITDAAGAQLANFTRDTAATLYPASGTVPGYSPVSATIIDSNTIQSDTALQGIVGMGGTARLITYVKFFGNTLGGRYVESNEFEFPVDVCRGCLISFSQADVSPLFTSPNCLGGGGASSTLPGPCFPGQDFRVDCSQCLTFPACNPPATALGGGVDAGAG